jgi:DnaJ-class molecular chaperone
VLSDLQNRALYDKDPVGFTKANGEYTLDAALALFERFFSTVSTAKHRPPSSLLTVTQTNPFAAVDAGVEGALKLTRDRTPKPIPDVVVNVPVTLEELFSGASKVCRPRTRASSSRGPSRPRRRYPCQWKRGVPAVCT